MREEPDVEERVEECVSPFTEPRGARRFSSLGR